jgi:hypothetical protein
MEQRFTKFIEKTDGCWNWKGHVGRNGYGQFSVNNIATSVHRVAYRLWIGDIPDGSVVHHKCSTKACVNPKHLQAVTPQENVAEMIERNFYLDKILDLQCDLAKAHAEVARLQKILARHRKMKSRAA